MNAKLLTRNLRDRRAWHLALRDIAPYAPRIIDRARVLFNVRYMRPVRP